jgi:hypothetical protein
MNRQNQSEQLANTIAQQLRDDDAHLSKATAQRLQKVRENAMQHFAQTSPQKNANGTLAMSLAQYRYPVVLLLCAIVLSLSYVWMQSRTANLTTDAYLLSEDLPPEAFVDEEFDTWITKDSY